MRVMRLHHSKPLELFLFICLWKFFVVVVLSFIVLSYGIYQSGMAGEWLLWGSNSCYLSPLKAEHEEIGLYWHLWFRGHWKNILSPTLVIITYGDELQRMIEGAPSLVSLTVQWAVNRQVWGRKKWDRWLWGLRWTWYFNFTLTKWPFYMIGEHHGESIKQLHKRFKQHFVSEPALPGTL